MFCWVSHHHPGNHKILLVQSSMRYFQPKLFPALCKYWDLFTHFSFHWFNTSGSFLTHMWCADHYSAKGKGGNLCRFMELSPSSASLSSLLLCPVNICHLGLPCFPALSPQFRVTLTLQLHSPCFCHILENLSRQVVCFSSLKDSSPSWRLMCKNYGFIYLTNFLKNWEGKFYPCLSCCPETEVSTFILQILSLISYVG